MATIIQYRATPRSSGKKRVMANTTSRLPEPRGDHVFTNGEFVAPLVPAYNYPCQLTFPLEICPSRAKFVKEPSYPAQTHLVPPPF